MLIALGRFVDRFGLSAVGVQYQQGLARCCAASDFAEGAIGNAERFPIPTADGRIVRPGKAIPCINEVDMGTAIPQTMLWRLLDSLGLPAETTLHDIRWGSEFEGTFYWDLEISGAVPFAHLKGGIAGATGYRQSPMYFPKGGVDDHRPGQGRALRLGARALRGHRGRAARRHRPRRGAAGGRVRAPPSRDVVGMAAPELRARRRLARPADGRTPEQPHHHRLRRRGRSSTTCCARSSPRRLTQNIRPVVAGAAFAAL